MLRTNALEDTNEPSQSTGVLIGYALGFLGLCLLFSSFVADDAYIVGRYAMNAASGHGLVYNPGEWVTALTSPLHALLETLFALIGFDPVISYRLVAPVFVLAGWFVAVRATGLRGSALLLFSALSLFSPFFALWTVGGLETPMLAFFATLFTTKLVVIKRSGVATGLDFTLLGILAGLMFLTRHDSVIFSAPILIAVMISEFRRPSLWIGAAISLAIAGSWLLFSYAYYGEILPTSYYVKLAVVSRPAIDSIGALLNFCLLSGLVVIALFVRRTPSNSQTALSKAIGIGAVISFVLFTLYSTRAAGVHMMFGYRHFMPYLMAASLVLTLMITGATARLAAITLSWQIALIAIVNFSGINPAPLDRFAFLGQAYVEYKYITPKAQKELRIQLREDAEAIKADWQKRQIDEQPRLYLRAGGMGYWLPDFYVYETLVSYRHDCGIPAVAMINASHYMQQLGFSRTGTFVHDVGRARSDIADDADLIFATELDWMGPTDIGYLFGPDPIPLDLGDRVGAVCTIRKPDQ